MCPGGRRCRSASTHYIGDWLAQHRNVTFHYSEMHPDKAAHGRRRSPRRWRTRTNCRALSTSARMSPAFGSGSRMRS